MCRIVIKLDCDLKVHVTKFEFDFERVGEAFFLAAVEGHGRLIQLYNSIEFPKKKNVSLSCMCTI